MSQTNYMQVINPEVKRLITTIEAHKRTVKRIWDAIRDYDSELLRICGCQSNVWKATTPDGLGITQGLSYLYCDYHKPVMMNESRA